MHWLGSHHTNFMCYEKTLRLNRPTNETLSIYNDKTDTNLQIGSHFKTQKYPHEGYHVFPIHAVDEKEEVKNVEDVPEVRNHPEVSPPDLVGIPLV